MADLRRCCGGLASPELDVIAGWRGLIVLLAIATGLAIAVVVGRSSKRVPEDRAVFFSFDPIGVAALQWNRPASPEFAIVRGGDGAWRFLPPRRNRIDQRSVETVLATLRGARWHRRAARARAGVLRAALTVEMSTQRTYVVGFGEAIAGADQTWITIDNQAYLVDGWVARSLDIEPLALCVRQPFESIFSGEASIQIVRNGQTLDIRPRPWRDARGWLAPSAIEPVLAALANLRVVRLAERRGESTPKGSITPASPGCGALPSRECGGGSIHLRTPAQPGLSISLIRCSHQTDCGSGERIAAVGMGGACAGAPQLIELISAEAEGCVEATAWEAVIAALEALDRPADDVLDHRPIGDTPIAIKLPDGVIHLDKRPRLEIEGAVYAADPARVAELIAALAAPADVIAAPVGPPSASIEVILATGATATLSRYGSLRLVRSSESIGLRSVSVPMIFRPIRSYIDPTRWTEDVTSVRTLTVKNTRSGDSFRYVRGPVIGEWLREGHASAAATNAVVEAVAQAVASVRAPTAEIPSGWTPMQSVTVEFASPVGHPTMHRLDLDRPSQGGCLARIDGVASVAPPALCIAVAAVRDDAAGPLP